jgi:hypothetical protein
MTIQPESERVNSRHRPNTARLGEDADHAGPIPALRIRRWRVPARLLCQQLWRFCPMIATASPADNAPIRLRDREAYSNRQPGTDRSVMSDEDVMDLILQVGSSLQPQVQILTVMPKARTIMLTLRCKRSKVSQRIEISRAGTANSIRDAIVDEATNLLLVASSKRDDR